MRSAQPWNVAKTIADILMRTEETMAVDAHEVDKSADLLKSSRNMQGDVVIRQVKKLHDQPGHPSNAKLVGALRDIGAAVSVLACAREYACEACL